jgi:Skp family chaperone for outer membrane proteins
MSSRTVSIFFFILVLLVLGCSEHSSYLTDTQPALKHECHSKTDVHLKELLQKPQKAFQGFRKRIYELHAKLDADTLLNLSLIPNKSKHKIEKAFVKKQCLFTARCQVAN